MKGYEDIEQVYSNKEQAYRNKVYSNKETTNYAKYIKKLSVCTVNFN